MDTSYLEKQVSTIINKLHELFDEIGVPSHERDTRESDLFTALSETLHNQLRIVTNEKHELAEEANRLITTIKQMHMSLEGGQQNEYDMDNMRVTYPLQPCLVQLKEKHKMVHKLHRERYEQVKKLAQAIESYSSHLEPSFGRIKLPPTSPNAACPPTFDLSHAYFASLDDEFTRVYEEYEHRLATVKTLSAEIINFWAELGTPQAQTDSNIVTLAREAPEQLGLHSDDIKRLQARRDKLSDEKKNRERKLKDLRSQIDALWEKLSVPESEQKGFLAANRGCGMRTINEFEDELSRLNELKRQNLGVFVEAARDQIQQLWDSLYFSEEEMLEFTPAFSDVYSDALLSAHESEIVRLEALREQRAPTLDMIDKHRSLIKDRDDLAASSQDASRLMLRGQKGEKRDPTRLLREEKMRKRIAKDLPRIEAELKNILEAWEGEYGRPFLVHGERYLDDIALAQAKAAPARSKTPNAPATVTKTTKVPLKAESTGRAATMRGAPSRAKTPTNFGTGPRNGFSSSHAPDLANSNKSPSRIPARAPLSNLQHGNNSPERKARNPTPGKDNGLNAVVRMGPPRIPPPKMKDLFSQSMMTPMANREIENLERSGSMVRHMPPEDVYDDRSGANSQMSHNSTSTYMSRSAYAPSYPASHHSSLSAADTTLTLHSNQQHHHYQTSARNLPQNNAYSYPMAPPSRPESRQISNTSNTSSNPSQISGSENWETYDDASEAEAEVDASEAYYAKVRAAQARGKRATPEGGWVPHSHNQNGGAGKKVRGLVNVGAGAMRAVDGDRDRESGWTDEEAF
ncbi:microtubule associated protein [Tothia fuscella]|uniref:Microtubule associated protein n=1 Tax=Tothia fuscella TaxID=1048955 RepID=A0A9P4NVE2_9PEZI|nr:microtubule associated protein [Tothia fuscella]